ncbi:hypothetical protein O181_038232 [Austropuccinia psidii MF-1]|uniref:Uncharacterized protein n=1 Tax=Austropuccinia psidii MF-1 TaxID=1389203 RepID=A0A9Q3DAI8_9BASI|nr:hypothetical protein [Austropuccinia psidii MF-1]
MRPDEGILIFASSNMFKPQFYCRGWHRVKRLWMVDRHPSLENAVTKSDGLNLWNEMNAVEVQVRRGLGTLIVLPTCLSLRTAKLNRLRCTLVNISNRTLVSHEGKVIFKVVGFLARLTVGFSVLPSSYIVAEPIISRLAFAEAAQH